MPLYAVKGRQVHRIWMWDRASALSQVFRTICVEPNSGDLVCAIEDENGDFHQLNASYAGAGTPPMQSPEFGAVFYGEFGDLINGGGCPLGPGSYAGRRATAAGAGAHAGGDRSSVGGNQASDSDFASVSVWGARPTILGNHATGVGENITLALQSSGMGSQGESRPRSGHWGYSCHALGDQNYVIGTNAIWDEDDALVFVTPTAAGDTPTFVLAGASSSDQRKTLDIATAWVDSTDATRKASVSMSVYDTAAREFLSAEADGSGVKMSLFGAPAVAQQAHIADVPTAGSATAADNATAINAILARLENIGINATS